MNYGTDQISSFLKDCPLETICGRDVKWKRKQWKVIAETIITGVRRAIIRLKKLKDE